MPRYLGARSSICFSFLFCGLPGGSEYLSQWIWSQYNLEWFANPIHRLHHWDFFVCPDSSSAQRVNTGLIISSQPNPVRSVQKAPASTHSTLASTRDNVSPPPHLPSSSWVVTPPPLSPPHPTQSIPLIPAQKHPALWPVALFQESPSYWSLLEWDTTEGSVFSVLYRDNDPAPAYLRDPLS